MKKYPNLLFIFTDQQRYDTLKAYGNTKIRVPNLNKLAEESIVFRRAYDTQPVCTPARGSILTGLYPHNHGCTGNNIMLDESIPTLPEMIEKSIYKTAYIGKWHLGNEINGQHGFDEWISIEDQYNQYYSDEADKSRNCDYFNFLIQNGFEPNAKRGLISCFSRPFCTQIPEQYSKAAFVAEKSIDFINRNKENSFILYINFLEPHSPYNSAFDGMYDPQDIQLPLCFDKELGDDVPLKHHFNRRYHKEHQGLDTEGKWRYLIARYWGAVSLIDKYVGKIVDAIRNNRLENDTVIVFTSDHGDMMGDFGMLAKCVQYESATRIPLMIRIPGMTEKQNIIEEPVSHIDLVPTLLDIMGLEIPPGLDGKSLYPAIKGEETLEDNHVFIEWNGNEGGEVTWFKNYKKGEWEEKIRKVEGTAMRTLITPDGWKLTIAEADKNQLYNLNDDPGETKNLYYDDKYHEKAEELTQKLIEWIKSTNDKGFNYR